MEDATPEASDGLMGDDAAARERVLKFEVQMYRLRDGEYVVDFQVGCPAVTICCTNQGQLHLLVETRDFRWSCSARVVYQ